jgi:predicted nucleic acid-binding protein
VKLYALDASAWLRLFLRDGPLPAALEPAAACVQQGAGAFVAPELILVEVAHVLQRKRRAGYLSSEEAGELWSDMRRTPLDLLPIADDIQAAIELAEQHNLSVYDALYLAVARRVGAALLTADEALQRVADELGLSPTPG